MTEDEKKLMEHFGVSVEQETVYCYKSYRYRNLSDALSYAKRVTEWAKIPPEHAPAREAP